MPGSAVSPLRWQRDGTQPEISSLAIWCDYTGQSLAEAAQAGAWLNAIHPQDRARIAHAWNQSLQTYTTLTCFCLIQRANHDYQYHKMLVVPLFEHAGSLQQWLVFLTKETPPLSNNQNWEDRYHTLLATMQHERAEGEAHTRLIETAFASITDGIIVCDATGKVIHSNPALANILHLNTLPGFLNMPFTQRIQYLQAFHADGQPFTPEDWPLQQLLRGTTLTTSEAEDIREILPDGEEIYVTHAGAPMRDEHDQIIGAILVICDVTRRRRLELHIRQSLHALLALAEALVHIPGRHATEQYADAQTTPTLSVDAIGQYLVELTRETLAYQSVAIALVDPEINQLNLVAITGFAPVFENLEHTYGTSFALSDYFDQAALARLQANEVVLWDLSPHNPAGQPYTLLTAPMLLDKRLTGIFSVKKLGPRQEYFPEEVHLVKAVAKLILLVIERERLQTQWIESHSSELALRETNRRFDEFLSIASHELRTPLTGIKGNIQLTLRRLAKLKVLDPAHIPNFQAKLEHIEDNLRHAAHRVNMQNRLISDLLDVSRIQANKLELLIHPCNLVDIIIEAVEDQRYNEPGRVITLTWPSDQPLTVDGDADRLGQVIHNYLTNALKYSPVTQPVTVSITCSLDRVRVTIDDKGPGLTPEEQARIWERFYRVKGINTQNNADPGLGLGLHINRTIIEAHYGTFGLASTPGQGSSFWFELPLLQVATPHAQSSLEPAQDTC